MKACQFRDEWKEFPTWVRRGDRLETPGQAGTYVSCRTGGMRASFLLMSCEVVMNHEGMVHGES